MRPPFETFKFATCKGSYMLGTACGECEKCAWIRNQAMSNQAMSNEANPISEVTAERASEAVQRLINSHFGQPNAARSSIPAHPDDDDLVAFAYVKQSTGRIAAITAEIALAKGLLEVIQQALVDQHWQTLGDLYRGKTLFLSQDLLNRIDTALEDKGDG